MILICCVDNHMGMSFNNRRQSKDRVVSSDILYRTSKHTLWVEPKSAELFLSNKVRIKEHCMESAAHDDFCFIEDPIEIKKYADNIDGIIFYNWNRVYPADQWFPLSVMRDWVLDEIRSFWGCSHDQITVCSYIKKGEKHE